jgi:putative colanic acid biosynthesis glycosyltransferase
MKVLQINSVCGVGSTGRIATDIDKILKVEGNESYIAFGRGNPKLSDTTIKVGSQLDNYIHVAKTRFFDKHGFASKKATKDFINRIEELDPDIIHLHNIHGYYINIEVLFEYLKKANKPVVWTLHDCWPFTGHCSYFDYVGCDKWLTECHNCPQTKNYPSSFIVDNSRDNFYKKKEFFTGINNLTIVTPSNWLAGIVKKSFLKDYHVEVINNGIDLEVFRPIDSDFREKLDIKDKFIILGVAGTWEKRKGYEYFYYLSKEISEDEVIVMVGLTEKQIKELPENIIGIKKTDSVMELAEIYSAANVFVNPTLEDNFPTTNLEALACGTPVITFDTGGSVESVKDGTGYIVEKGHLQDLLPKIKEIKTNGKLSYTNKIKKHVADSYNKDDRFKDYINLYKKILENKKKS